MLYLTGILTAATLVLSALGRPVTEDHPLLRRLDVGDTQCFTQHGATASDCQALLTDPSATPDWTNVASAGVVPIFRPFCSESCCLFTDTKDVVTDALISAGTTLLGCEETANALVNGVTKTKAAGICLADKSGASGCFHDDS
ncbi:hypothetical protein C8R43DRAFT_352099 [Mycena crocata]|nr:hypothetical protein C8R43DRAFT_352099 [Mycena crocata]